MKSFLKNWSPVLLFLLLNFIGSSLPVHVPEGPDKILHMLEFSFMGFFTTRAILLTWNLPRLWAWIAGSALAGIFGVLDEIHQAFVPGRQSSPYDALADLAGGMLGAFLFLYLGTMLGRSGKLYSGPHDKCC